MDTTRQTRTDPEGAEVQPCRTCGHLVTVTRDEQGWVEQLDGAGDVICGACWAAQP